MKSIQIQNIYYEMLVAIAKKNKPSAIKPEKMLEKLIEQRWNS